MATQVKIPAIKKELIRCKNTIQEININMNNILVDEYSIRWNCIPVEDSKEANLTIDWPLSFKLINNEFKTKCNVTNQEDAVWNTVDSAKCPRCNVMDKDWEHLWVCEKNDDITSEYASLENSIHEILQEIKMNDSDEINVRLVEMKDALIEVSKSRSCIEVTENVLRELTRGDKDIIYKICDRYMDKIQKLFWNKETIELEKIRGITKELKRIRGKKVIESEGDEENSKDNVFRLGEYDKNKWGIR
ncbi:hypothetical protein RhiirA1_476932 [Rhizophagus irregularis]|uniref:Uncharacterized protein n=1 Tax=Rhizophagus irregularis TaxID=588596 RepID=A0A2I1F415_9GLOM|nr:hypothetical protein RhiirA1_476932 [Rhizophagus irregularis]PKY29117.1 hypothetical protein RhiirB3_445622 [Rhizophagus irregularis]